eukprot:EG_transcript_4692
MGLVAVYFRHCREGEDAETALLDEKQPSLMLTMRQTTLNMIASAGLVKDRTDNSMPVEVVISLPEVAPAVKPHLPMAQSSTEIPACMAAGHSTLLCDDISYLVRDQLPIDENAKPHLALPEFSLTTLNVHAPIHKRIEGGTRESTMEGLFIPRNSRILDLLLSEPPTVICLQEFWICNDKLASMYQGAFGPAGYNMYLTPRTNCRGDGLLTMVAKGRFDVLDHQRIELNDCADRVGHLLHLKGVGSAPGQQEALVVNTHLMFPHNTHSRLIRLRQCAKLLSYLQSYALQHGLAGVPIVIAGDWNGEPEGAVARFMRSQGFVSAYDELNADKGRWVSHLNHHAEAVGVDYVWLLNPSDQCGSLTSNWQQLVCGCITAELLSRGIATTAGAYGYFDARNRGFITPADFLEGLKALKLIGDEGIGLLENEIEELAVYVDGNQDGVIDREEFAWLLDMTGAEELMAVCEGDIVEFLLKYAACHARCPMHVETFNADLQLLDASFPDSFSRGVWPEGYREEISDHAPLSVKFSFAPTPATQPNPQPRGLTEVLHSIV